MRKSTESDGHKTVALTNNNNFKGLASEKERKSSMKGSMNKFVPTIVLGFALGGAGLAFAGPDIDWRPCVRPFHADDSGAVVVTGSSSPFDFSETGWTGHATHLGAMTWEATGTITVTGGTGSLLDIKVHGDFTIRGSGESCDSGPLSPTLSPTLSKSRFGIGRTKSATKAPTKVATKGRTKVATNSSVRWATGTGCS